MKKISRFFGKLPLCGKYAIRSSIARIVNSRNRNELTKSSIAYLLLFVCFIVLHAIQAYMGYRLLSASVNTIATIIGVGYMVINLAVCLEQVYLTCRIVGIIVRRRKKYCVSRHSHSLNHDSNKQQDTALVCTLVGQIVFMSAYVMWDLL